MKMPGVEAEELFVADRVAQVKLVRADNVALRADAEEFAFDRIEVEFRIDPLAEDFIQRLLENLPRRFPVGWRIFVAIGNPDVRHARCSQLAAKFFADLAARLPVANPEFADAFIPARQREPVRRLRMRE